MGYQPSKQRLHFTIVNVFIDIPVEDVLQVIRNRLSTDASFPEQSPLQVEEVMELLDICLTSTYFQFEVKFCQQKEGMTVRIPLFLMVSNKFMEQFEEIALDIADHKTVKWLRYFDDTFMVTWTSKTAAISSPY
jgi:hypothetical protein